MGKVMPERPFDGRMKKLRLVVYFCGGILISSLAFIATFIYYYLVRYLHFSPLLLLIPVLFAEIVLLYVNNVARVKYKLYFMELNPFWSKMDKKDSTLLSLILHFCLVMLTATATLLIAVEAFFLVFGALIVNLLLDYVTTALRVQCVKLRCPNLVQAISCLECKQMEEKKPDDVR